MTFFQMNTYHKTANNYSQWSFIPHLLSGSLGVCIGLILANALGWI
jgi:hypothetical protein